MNRTFLGQPSRRTDDHFDWLMNRPNERAACAADDAHFDVDGCERVRRSLICVVHLDPEDNGICNVCGDRID